MTSAVLSPGRGVTRQAGRFAGFVTDVWVLTKRSLARIRREPETLAEVTIQPILFVLMFTYVFGGAIGIPGGGSYHEYLIGGMLGMGLAQTAPGTAVAVVTDMSTGLIDRFRSLPMSRAAVLSARTVADLLTQVIGAIVVAGVGLAIGWRVHTGPGDIIAAFALALLFGYAFTWVGACLGMVLRSPEAAQQSGFVIFLPLTFISSAFVPTQGMPGWLQPVAEWNPMSALAAACRHLFGNPNPAAAVHAWPMQHPQLAVIAWSVAMLVVFAPLAVRLYRRKALG
ncbi:MAG: ABC transporter permease [Streptosporangiaceae bacterium]|nr:ABC transporter permease [Streptosporangiaceae bacterium]MBV9854141.1 ABC transporter permease [Streptosporangiaceae bacterium]